MIIIGKKTYEMPCPNCGCTEFKVGDKVLLCKECETIRGREKRYREMDYAAGH
jgi:hypothetical protein